MLPFKSRLGAVEPLSLVALVLLVVTLAIGTAVTSNTRKSFEIRREGSVLQATSGCGLDRFGECGGTCGGGTCGWQGSICGCIYPTPTPTPRPAATPVPTSTPTPTSTCDPDAWSAWSTCSAGCGGGTQSRTNQCGTRQTQSCNTQSCSLPSPTPTPTPTFAPTPIPTAPPNTCSYTCTSSGICSAEGGTAIVSQVCSSGQTCCNFQTQQQPTPTPAGQSPPGATPTPAWAAPRPTTAPGSPTTAPTAPPATGSSASCLWGASSCSSFGRYSGSGCTNCPSGVASCCGVVIPASADACLNSVGQHVDYRCVSSIRVAVCKSDKSGYNTQDCAGGWSCSGSTGRCAPAPTPTPALNFNVSSALALKTWNLFVSGANSYCYQVDIYKGQTGSYTRDECDKAKNSEISLAGSLRLPSQPSSSLTTTDLLTYLTEDPGILARAVEAETQQIFTPQYGQALLQMYNNNPPTSLVPSLPSGLTNKPPANAMYIEVWPQTGFYRSTPDQAPPEIRAWYGENLTFPTWTTYYDPIEKTTPGIRDPGGEGRLRRTYVRPELPVSEARSVPDLVYRTFSNVFGGGAEYLTDDEGQGYIGHTRGVETAISPPGWHGGTERTVRQLTFKDEVPGTILRHEYGHALTPFSSISTPEYAATIKWLQQMVASGQRPPTGPYLDIWLADVNFPFTDEQSMLGELTADLIAASGCNLNLLPPEIRPYLESVCALPRPRIVGQPR